MTETEHRTAMVQLAKSLFERGYATGGAGNLTVMLDDGRILATPTGASFGRLEASRLSLLSADGEHLSGDRPSKEAAFHLAIYQARPECRAIVHLHSTWLTALSCLEDLDPANAIRPFTPYYVMRVGQLPVVPYLNPGDPRIASELAALAPDHRAYLLANHGPVVTGKDLWDAVDNMEELEETAKLDLLLRDKAIAYLSQENIELLQARGA